MQLLLQFAQDLGRTAAAQVQRGGRSSFQEATVVAVSFASWPVWLASATLFVGFWPAFW